MMNHRVKKRLEAVNNCKSSVPGAQVVPAELCEDAKVSSGAGGAINFC